MALRHRPLQHNINRIKRLLACFLAAWLLAVPTLANADSYTVNAAVLYPTPTQPAAIDPVLNSTTVAAALATITGTCQLMNPAAVVAIWQGTTAIGSAPCNGSFSVQVILQPGENVLIAKTTNATGQTGPDSAPITMTLTLPVSPPPPTNPSTLPTSPASEIISVDAGVVSDLHAETADTYSVMSSGKAVSLQVIVGGGDHPYDIRLDWGDGSIDIRTVDQPGTYEFSHIYQTVGAYKVHGVVRDVLGAYTEFDHAVLSTHATPTHAAAGTTAAIDSGNAWWHSSAFIWTVVAAAIILLFVISYWLGWHRASDRWKKRMARGKKQRLLVGAKRKKRKQS